MLAIQHIRFIAELHSSCNVITNMAVLYEDTRTFSFFSFLFTFISFAVFIIILKF